MQVMRPEFPYPESYHRLHGLLRFGKAFSRPCWNEFEYRGYPRWFDIHAAEGDRADTVPSGTMYFHASACGEHVVDDQKRAASHSVRLEELRETNAASRDALNTAEWRYPLRYEKCKSLPVVIGQSVALNLKWQRHTSRRRKWAKGKKGHRSSLVDICFLIYRPERFQYPYTSSHSVPQLFDIELPALAGT